MRERNWHDTQSHRRIQRLVARRAEHERLALARRDLMHGAQRLLLQMIARTMQYHGELLIDQCERAVLELARCDGLAVQVGDLFDLERAFETGRPLIAAADQQQRVTVRLVQLARNASIHIALREYFHCIKNINQERLLLLFFKKKRKIPNRT